MCIFKLPFWVKLSSHMLHWKDFFLSFPSWADCMCLFKVPLVLNVELHISQLRPLSTTSSEKTFSLVCGSSKLSSSGSFLIAILSPCTKLKWRSNTYFSPNCKLHFCKIIGLTWFFLFLLKINYINLPVLPSGYLDTNWTSVLKNSMGFTIIISRIIGGHMVMWIQNNATYLLPSHAQRWHFQFIFFKIKTNSECSVTWQGS